MHVEYLVRALTHYRHQMVMQGSLLHRKLLPIGYPEFINRMIFSEFRGEIISLLSDRCDAQTASKRPLLGYLLLNFHRQTSLAFQSEAALQKEVESLKVLHFCPP